MGEANQGHGLTHCDYVGRLKYGIRAFITAIFLNIKGLVKILTDIKSKPQIYQPALGRSN